MSNTKGSICYLEIEPCKLMQLATFHFFKFFLGFIQKAIIGMLDKILNSVSPLNPLTGICDLTNTIKPPFVDVICRLYGLSSASKTNWLLENDLFSLF